MRVSAAVHTVCQIITKLELGGAQKVALFTAAHLDRARFRPVLLTGPGGLLTDEAKALPGVAVEIVPSLGRAIRPFRDAPARAKNSSETRPGRRDTPARENKSSDGRRPAPAPRRG